MRKVSLIAVGMCVLAFTAWRIMSPIGDPRTRAEHEHRIRLPASAHNIQCTGDASRGFLDRGAATMFEMSTNDLTSFVAQLRIKSRATPVQTAGDPTVNGYNVWPRGAQTFVPGNACYGGFRRTWQGDAAAVEMLSCASPTGDWLHVE